LGEIVNDTVIRMKPVQVSSDNDKNNIVSGVL
jgi:hypothetical protein